MTASPCSGVRQGACRLCSIGDCVIAGTLARKAIRVAQRLLPAADDGLVVLAYHLVGAGSASPVDVPQATFDAQLDELVSEAEVVSLSEWVGRAGVPVRPSTARPRVALTFDDAYENFYTHAWPALRARGLPATLYVPVAFVEGKASVPMANTTGLKPCSWGQLREMRAEGLHVGSHSLRHRNLRQLDQAAIADEVVRSRETLEERLNGPIETFCYPQAKVGAAAERLVRATYRTAVVGGGRRNHLDRLDPHRISRVSLRRDMPRSVMPIVRARVWLEEWLADQSRRWRP